MGAALGDAGQHLGRAYAANATASQRKQQAEQNAELHTASMTRANLQNQLLAIQVAEKQSAAVNQSQVGPAVPEPMKVEVIPGPAKTDQEILPGQGIATPLPGGGKVAGTSGRQAQQTVEDSYGGVIGELYGASWAFHDIAKHLQRKYGLSSAAARYRVAEWLRKNARRKHGPAGYPR